MNSEKASTFMPDALATMKCPNCGEQKFVLQPTEYVVCLEHGTGHSHHEANSDWTCIGCGLNVEHGDLHPELVAAIDAVYQTI